MLIVNLASGQQPKETKRVLILITGQMDVPGYELSRKGMETALAKSTNFHFEYFIEYIDWYRFKDRSYEKSLLDLYRKKYSDKKIDLLIAHGYHALRLVAAYRQDFLSHVPVVFSTVFKRQVERLDLDKKFAGSLVEIDFEGLLNTALNNHPDTRHVAIISGSSNVGRLIEKGIRAAYAAHADKYDFIYLGHLAMKDLLDRLAKLPDHTIVLYYILMLDGAQKEYKPWKVAGMISEAANAPVYGMADTYMGEGIVGGKLWSYEALGTKSGEIALRILEGENPADIPPTAEGTILNMFDWRQLKRWGINESGLPEGSIVSYKELSFWELYRWYIIGCIFLFSIQGFFIVMLAVQRQRAKQKEQLLRDSDERFKAFMNNSSEQIWCVEFDEPIEIDLPEDEQFELVYKHGYMAEANDAYARSVGFEHGEELVGTRIEEFCPRSDPKNVATVRAWIRGRYNITNAETVESYKDGVTRIILNNSTSIIENGRVVRVWGTGTDITDLKAVEDKLREAEQKYRTVADFTYDWEYWRAPDGCLLYVSPSCERITGYRPLDFVDEPKLIESIILPEDLSAWTAHSHASKLGPASSDCQFRIRAKDGTIRWIEHVCRPVCDEQGNYAGFRASNRDTTRLRLAEREAHENREALARLNRAMTLEKLASSIAHELNQPLTGILSNAQTGEMLLKRGDGNRTEIEEILTDIVADGKRSGDILRNLRDLFGKRELEFKLVGVNAIVKDTVRLLNSEFVIHGLTVHLNLSDKLPDVMGNKIQLQQVLINLINNAIQEMQNVAEADRWSISIFTERGNDGEVQVHVGDTGPGIDPEQLRDIFEPLTTLRPGGLGMGLSISRSIVEAHGGRIWAENIPAGGARISFILPAVKEES